MQQISMLQQETLDSRQVAEMLGKRHSDLIRDIELTREYFGERKIAFSDFFTESSYRAGANQKTYKCYQITKKGCEFLAHKLTGAKGAAFTARYIDAFHEMKNAQALLSGETAQAILLAQEKILARLAHLEAGKPALSGGTAEEITAYLARQRKSRKGKKHQPLLVETLPPEVRIIIDRLMLDESRNYSFIQTMLREKGYKISESALRNYYRLVLSRQTEAER